MGTNYYVKVSLCLYCGRSETLHVGKSSGGWCFALNTYPERGLETLDDWRHVLISNVVVDEYGNTASYLELLDIITNRSWYGGGERSKEWFEENFAETGPNGLARSKIGGLCVGHGEGTWDYMQGEFS